VTGSARGNASASTLAAATRTRAVATRSSRSTNPTTAVGTTTTPPARSPLEARTTPRRPVRLSLHRPGMDTGSSSPAAAEGSARLGNIRAAARNLASMAAAAGVLAHITSPQPCRTAAQQRWRPRTRSRIRWPWVRASGPVGATGRTCSRTTSTSNTSTRSISNNCTTRTSTMISTRKKETKRRSRGRAAGASRCRACMGLRRLPQPLPLQLQQSRRRTDEGASARRTCITPMLPTPTTVTAAAVPRRCYPRPSQRRQQRTAAPSPRRPCPRLPLQLLHRRNYLPSWAG